MRIVEIFQSKQGEGLWTGVESTFIRVGGCHLRCSFCDTPYASWYNDEGEDLCVEEVVGRVLLIGRRHVVLTGGEPMMYSEMIPLTRYLKERFFTVTIETAGTLELPVECNLMSISPKLSNSTPMELPFKQRERHEKNRMHPEIVQKLIDAHEYQLKFVIDQPEDLIEVEEYLQLLNHFSPSRIFLMPMATDLSTMREKALWMIPYCRKRKYNYCPRMQIEWYGNRRRT